MVLTFDDIFSDDSVWTHRRNGLITLSPLKGTEVAGIYCGQQFKNTGREIMFDAGLDNYSFNFTANSLPYGEESPTLSAR